MPAGAAPWLEGTPMAVSHDEFALDPAGSVAFAAPAYSLTFLPRTYGPPRVIDDGDAGFFTTPGFASLEGPGHQARWWWC